MERIELDVAGVPADAVDGDGLVHAAAHRADVESANEEGRQMILGHAARLGKGVLVERHSVREGCRHARCHDESRGGGNACRGRHGATDADLEYTGRVVLFVSVHEKEDFFVQIVESALVTALEVQRPVVLLPHVRLGVDGKLLALELGILRQ